MSDERIILADSREPKGLVLRLQMAAPIPVERCFLNSADYVITDVLGRRLGIERKTISDFLHTLGGEVKSGENRLFYQINKVCNDYENGALLLEGDWGVSKNNHVVIKSKETGWHLSAFQCALWSIQEKVRLITTTNGLTTVSTILALNERGRTQRLD